MTASYKFSWIISPFGLFLPICSVILYIKSHRLKLEDFKLKLLKKTNEIMNPINQDSSKLINQLDEQQSDLHFTKSQ
jgi:hypothetical protein